MKKIFLFVVSCMLIGSIQAQDLQQTLNQLAGNAALGYVDPISQGFLTNINGGLFHKAPQTKLFGIDLELGMVVMATPVSNLAKEFNATGSFRFNKDQADDMATNAITPTGNATLDAELKSKMSTAIQNSDFNIGIAGPTVFGKKYDPLDPTSEVKVTVNSNVTFTYTVPVLGTTRDTTLSVNQIVKTGLGGIGDLGSLTQIPFAAPQITLGTVLGTQFTLRYLPKFKIDNVGDLSWTGFGIQHNLGYWLPIPFIDVAASFYTQSLKIDPIFELSGTAFGVNASKQFGFSFLNLTPYAGFMLESSKMKVNYTPPAAEFGPGVTPPSIGFEIEGQNSSRITVGLSIRLLVFNINADYNIGKYNSMTAGLFFAI